MYTIKTQLMGGGIDLEAVFMLQCLLNTLVFHVSQNMSKIIH